MTVSERTEPAVDPTPETGSFDLRDRPTAEFIESMRARFPVDSELDAMLVRKLRRRTSSSYQRITLDDFVACLESLLRDNIDGDFVVSDARWLSGGASKMQMRFTLEWQDPDRGRVTDVMVVRMDPAESLNATSRSQEAQILIAVGSVLPVPTVRWLDESGRWFPEPALVYDFAVGVTKPTQSSTGTVSGLGTMFGPRLRATLGTQFVEQLAALHSLDVDALNLPSFDRPAPGTSQAAEWKLNQYQRVWEEDRGEDFPLMDVAARWLRRNLPTVDTVSVIHGDYRSGNFLFDEESSQITAWLDWEYCHLGDRHRDLAWATDATFGHRDPATGEYLVCGLFSEEEFLKKYCEASGFEVDRERLAYYKISNTYQLIVATRATAYRISRLGKTHQDVLLAWVSGMVPVLSRQLVDLLKERI
ncbi:phosphotransferase family protein [Gordonia rubripertincta]|uniref:Phosphotransferase family protein n=1 Tax=Gordonia rubripertincta TaxID=36822 RepID=A0AAW6RFG3_GORRU|nr:phosphotransferase family protein [Gordonia rubripertincta]MDG6782436.1 phosphotransferase family protein [Gordonia rubripertincta]NKY64533.1 phosphotransferase family protein [Gordonia rubripertincta]